MRTLPGWSVIGRDQVLSAVQVAVAVVALPVSSTRPSGDTLLLPLALFQSDLKTTPADSELPISMPLPTKWMLMALGPEPLAVVMLSVTVAVCVSEPLVPVIVRMKLPEGVLDDVVIVSVELVPEAVEVGL